MPVVLDQNQQDYATQIARSFNLQSRIPGHLDSRLQMGFTVDDLTTAPFWHLRRGTSWQAMRSAPGVAAEKGWVQLSGSVGTLTLLYRAIVVNNTGGPLSFGYGVGAFKTGVIGGGTSTTDDRDFSGVSPAAAAVADTDVAPVVPQSGYCVLASPSNYELPLGEGVVLTGKANSAGVVPAWSIVCNQINSAFDVVLFFKERPILDSERA